MKVLKKIIAVSLLVVIALTSMPVQAVAEEIDQTAMAVDTVNEERLNYIYIESPYVATPDTQRVIVSWGDGNEDISDMSIKVCGNSDRQDWEISRKDGNLYLFERTYTQNEESGVYNIESIRIEENGEWTEYGLNDLGVRAYFGVNQEYDGIDELKPLDVTEENTDIETSIVTVDENGEIREEKKITDTLSDASQNIIATLSDEREVRSSEIVVALDPGHDAKHTGASANGVREEELTLKIAQYCKQELEQYNGIRVYMTRTTSACPYPDSSSSGQDIARRVKASVAAGAKIYVSFHLNSSVASRPKGAEVIVPNYNWRPQVGADGHELGQKILSELTGLGLENRGIYSKNTTANEYYPDGSLSDYFSVQINAKENNIPGIIVEHAFVSNTSDVTQFLNNEAGLKKLGIADATGIAKFLGVNKGYWENIDGKWKYNVGNSTYLKSQWILTNEQWYYVDASGYRVTGWQNIGNFKYYFDESGRMQTGWISYDNKWYYLGSSGNVCTGWQNIGKFWYYFDEIGRMYTGWQNIGQFRYYFGSSGNMYTGWQNIDDKTYYFGSSGNMYIDVQQIDGIFYKFDTDGTYIGKLSGWSKDGNNWYYYDTAKGKVTGWQNIGKFWYYFDKTGRMETGWQNIGQFRYYFGSSGNMYIGWQEVDKKKYYFGPSGNMYTGMQTINGELYYFNADGSLGNVPEGWEKELGIWYYYDNTGKKVTGWQNIGQFRYYFNGKGEMQTSWQKLNNVYYYFGPSGNMYTGWQNIGQFRYYFNEKGEMQISWQKLDNVYYYFGSLGNMYTGWQNIGQVWYYFNENGQMQTSWKYIGKFWYYFGTSGNMYTGWKNIGQFRYYFGTSGNMYTGWQKINGMQYYFGSSGNMYTGIQVIDGKTYYFDDNGCMQTLHTIMGKSDKTKQQLVAFYKKSGYNYPASSMEKGDAATIEELCDIYIDEARKEGVRVEVAFAQAMLETKYLQYGNDVKIEQFNFAGIGATGNGNAGNSFSDVRTGVRAQIQHLKAYATTEPLKQSCVDPRYTYVKKGCSEYVETLGQKENPTGNGWATSEKYGINIAKLIDQM